MNSSLFISVVVPVFNEERFIAATLEQILGQDYPEERFEVLVVDGGSEDATREIVSSYCEQYGNVRLLDNPGRKSSSGRNIGFKNGEGEYFLVIDGHCHIPNFKLLRNLAEIVERTGASCLGRPQTLDAPGGTPFQEAVASVRGSRLGHGSGSLIYGEHEGFASPVSNGAAYGREVFETIGYVDEDFDACEDVEFNLRVEKAGFKSYTSPKLKVSYYPRETLPGLFRQMQRYGAGRCRLWRKHPDSLSMNSLVPPAFALLCMAAPVFILLGLLTSLPILLGGLLLIPLAAYLALICRESYRLTDGGTVTGVLTRMSIFATVHLGLGGGFLLELLRGKRGNQRERQSVPERRLSIIDRLNRFSGKRLDKYRLWRNCKEIFWLRQLRIDVVDLSTWSVPRPEAKVPLEFTVGDEQDIDRICSTEAFGARNMLERWKRGMLDGNVLFLAKTNNNETVSVLWANRHMKKVAGSAFRLKPDEYVFEYVMTLASWYGKGIHQALHYHALSYLKDLGATRAYLDWNMATIAMQKTTSKLGYLYTGTDYYVLRLFLRDMVFGRGKMAHRFRRGVM
ncbi:glycosyltransferase family 2 protein [Pseudodesulfovibrio cashew]|uniref:glycosyltransferase family 2 protein n=1 Tax=Pseudodesulfovibrio cashew TaxID=2678688 RepID=UPI001F554E65|nr:glycosyltransferase family 2 protein [Pseudodesulfovibrio cashew]